VATSQSVKSRLLVNLVLLLALVGLGLYAYLRPDPEAQTPGVAVTQLKREQISHIRVEPRGGPTIELARHGEQWRLEAPQRLRADGFQVDRLLDIVTVNSKEKLPRAELARFDLAPPRVSVTLNEQNFAFGAINEITNEQYLATADAVYLVPPHLGYGIPTEPSKLISPRLLGPDEAPMAFDFGRWKAVKDGQGKWSLSGTLPSKEALSQDDLNRWADEWKLVTSLAAQPHRAARGREAVTLSVAGGRKIRFEILAREPQVRLLRVDEGIAYQVGPEVGRRLTDPWTVAASK
jgi:hypothetical protein